MELNLALKESHDGRASQASSVTGEHDDAQTWYHVGNESGVARKSDDDDDAVQGGTQRKGCYDVLIVLGV